MFGKTTRCLFVALLVFGTASRLSAAPLNSNILLNSGFEGDGSWLVAEGKLGYGYSGPAPHGGRRYYSPTTWKWCSIYQDVNLLSKGYDLYRLVTGGYAVDYGGYQNCWDRKILGSDYPNDAGLIGLTGLSLAGNQTVRDDLGWRVCSGADDGWVHAKSRKPVQLGDNTITVRYTFWAERRYAWANNSAFLDDAYLKIVELDVWSWGDSGVKFGGQGVVYQNFYSAQPPDFGIDGKGGVEIRSGGTWDHDTSATLGVNAGSTGTVNVNGGKWSQTEPTFAMVLIGDDGKGTVNVTNNGIWNNKSQVRLGGHGSTTGQGEVNVSSGKWTSSGEVNIGRYGGQGTVNITGGTWQANSSVYIKKGAVTVDGGTWNSGTVTVETTAAKIDIKSGQWNGSANVYKGGVVNVTGGKWTGGTVWLGSRGTGTVNVKNKGEWETTSLVYLGEYKYASSDPAGDGKVYIDGCKWTAGGDVYVGKTGTGLVDLKSKGNWTTDGKVYLGYSNNPLNPGNPGDGTVNINDSTWTANGAVHVGNGSEGFIHVTNGGKLKTNGIFEIGRNSELILAGTKVWANGGLNMVTGKSTTAANAPYIKGNGTVLLGGSGLDLNNGGYVVGTSSSSRISLQGDISGSGHLENVDLGGNISVGNSPGSMHMTDVSLAGTSTITMELGGLTAGTEYDQIIVTGTLGAAGTLNVIWYGGFEAGNGDTFTLFDLSGGSISGTFDNVNLPAFSKPGWSWNSDNLYSNGEITAMPEPTVLALLGIGTFAIIRKRRSQSI